MSTSRDDHLQSAEHRRSLAERRGQGGEHIRPDEGTPQSMADIDKSELMAVIEQIKKSSEPKLGFRFDWSFGFGHLATIASLIGIGYASYYGIKGELQEQSSRIEMLAARVSIIERGRADNLPRLEEQIRSNGLQDQRIQNLTDALNSVRQTIIDQSRTITSLADLIHEAHEKAAILEERLGRAAPHDR